MEEKQNNIAEEKEIDLLALANKIWTNKKFILKALGIGLFIGLIVAFSIPKEYTTTVVLMPDTQASSTSSMSSLAALTGINLGGANNGDALASPDLYPNVFQSTPFIEGLFDFKVKDTKQGIDTTLYSYFEDFQKQAWWIYLLKAPGALIRTFSSDDSISLDDDYDKRILSNKEMSIIEALQSRLIVSSEKKTGITKIEVTMQSPEISAFLADSLTSYFQSYIIKYRTQKAREDLVFTEKLYEDARVNYDVSQQKLASFLDGNMHVVSAKYRTNQKKLEDEMALTYSIYNQTAQQLQLAKVKVQNTTPVFTVIQPAIEPLYPIKPKRKIIVISFAVLATAGACLWLLRREFVKLIY